MGLNRNLFFVIFLILLTIFLRFFFISNLPIRLTHDEMSLGYNAYSILKTGKDEWGQKFPLIFRAFGDYKLPVYIYFLVPFIAIFDLNDFSVKLHSVLAGILIVFYIYKLVLLLTKNKKTAFYSSLVCSISPWALQLSRQARESNLALAFFTIGLYYLLKSINTKSKKQIIISCIFFALTFYTYIAYRLFVILFILLILIISIIQYKNLNKIKNYLIVFSFILISLIPSIFSRGGTARFVQVSIFQNQGIEAEKMENYNFCYLVNNTYLPKICKIFFNKYVLIFTDFTKNYFKALSPNFLFINGSEINYLSVPNNGEFFLLFLPFYLIGIYELFSKKEFKFNILKIGFLLSPVASALTGELQTLRLSSLVLFTSIIIGFGINKVFCYLSNSKIYTLFKFTFITLFVFSLIKFSITYFIVYPTKFDNASYYVDSPKLVSYLKSVENNYEKIYIRKDKFTDFYIALAFYQKMDPKFLQENIVRPPEDNFGFSHPIQLGKYNFEEIDLNKLLCQENQKTLVVTDDSEKFPPDLIFKNFANVHNQAKIYNLEKTRIRYREMIKNNNYDFCTNKLN